MSCMQSHALRFQHMESCADLWPERQDCKVTVRVAVTFRVVQCCLCRQEKYGQIVLPSLAPNADGRVSEELCASASAMANNLGASAIFVYTRRGYMANFLSRCRPDCPIFAFTGHHTSPLPCCSSVHHPCSSVGLPTAVTSVVQIWPTRSYLVDSFVCGAKAARQPVSNAIETVMAFRTVQPQQAL